ncbi:tyrosine-type recombinase/integrase [Corynebacterium sp. S7]
MVRGRPATPLGTWGEINVEQLGPKKFRASTRLRKFNGDTVRVRAVGTSKTSATTNVKKRCAERLGVTDQGGLSSTSTMKALLETWIESKDDVRPQTLERYQTNIDKHLVPAFGNMRLNEVGPAFLDAWAKTLSTGVAATARTVLSGAFKLALRYEIIQTNPLAAVEFPVDAPDEVRALSVEEIPLFRKQIKKSKNVTLIDVTDFCLSTGLRAGEVLALRFEDVTENEDGHMTVTPSGTIAYSKKTGNHRQDEGKTAAANRPIPLSARASEIVRERQDNHNELGIIFPSGTGTFQWESNFNRLLRKFRGEQFSWVTIHTLRKTVASIVADELGPHKAADVLGHADSRLTERAYYERNRAGVPIGDVIDGVLKVSK